MTLNAYCAMGLQLENVGRLPAQRLPLETNTCKQYITANTQQVDAIIWCRLKLN